MVKKCTMTELLSKITLTKKKIDYYTTSREYSSLNQSSLFLGLKKKGEDFVNGQPSSVISDNIKGNYQSYTEHLKNWSKLLIIKNAVNTSVYITIAGSRMSIAEALAYNSTSVKNHCDTLIKRMKTDWAKAQSTIAEYNDQKFSEDKINAYVQTALGGVSSDEMERVKKTTPERIRELIETYKDINSMELIDPLNITERIDKWTEWYDEFFSTINFRLSEINSRIMIEYDLDKDTDFFRILNLDEINGLQ